MEYLKDIEKFGETFKAGEEFSAKYPSEAKDFEKSFSELTSFLERRIFNRISKRVNFLLTRINDQKLEIVADGNSDKNEDGNWRFYEDSGNLIIQKRVSGTWTNYLLQSGDANGQMLFWDGVKWAKTKTSELFWDDVEKALGINNSTPASGSKLDVGGTVVVTRILAGGVQP